MGFATFLGCAKQGEEKKHELYKWKEGLDRKYGLEFQLEMLSSCAWGFYRVLDGFV